VFSCLTLLQEIGGVEVDWGIGLVLVRARPSTHPASSSVEKKGGEIAVDASARLEADLANLATKGGWGGGDGVQAGWKLGARGREGGVGEGWGGEGVGGEGGEGGWRPPTLVATIRNASTGTAPSSSMRSGTLIEP
jgi:hypothetical protein